MNDQDFIDIATKSIWVTIKIASPALVAALVSGVVISILQAATQINEQTLSFVPKILTMTIVMVLAGPWILKVILNFTINLFHQIPLIIGG